MRIKRVYWDACNWLGLINGAEGRLPVLRYHIEQAEKGEIEIWTSAFTLAEVYKRRCDKQDEALPESQDQPFEDYLDQRFVKMVALDREIGTFARRLLRQHPKLRKPQDAVHLATAARYNVDEFHTFDHENVIPLNGQILRFDGATLSIGEPILPPTAASGPLFDTMESSEKSIEAAE